MRVCTLASGSSGNSILLSQGGTHLLVDAGVSCRRITAALRALGADPCRLLGVLVTHEHTDHIAGLPVLTRQYRLPVYASPGTLWKLRSKVAEDLLRPIQPGDPLDLGPFRAAPFRTSHDAAEPLGFSVEAGGRRMAVATDLGVVTPSVLQGVLGAGLVICEANHDVEWLTSGPYPYPLKARILGDKGHLSNEAGAALARQCAAAGAHTVLLAHLSAENNTPQRALTAAQTAFQAADISHVTLAVAPRNETSPVYEV